MPLKGVLIATLALAAAPGMSAADQAPNMWIRTSRDGEFVLVSASAVMRVDPRIAWTVLSDYDHLARFIPDLKSSRVVWREGDRVHVVQKGVVGFLFYKEAVDVTLEVHEEPPSRISARGIEGNVRGLETRYELQASASGVKLDYSGRFAPDFVIPPLIGMPIVNRLFERRFRAMVEEIERRDALARAAARQPAK